LSALQPVTAYVSDLIDKGSLYQIWNKKEGFGKGVRDTQPIRPMGECLIKAVTRLFAATGVDDQGTATSTVTKTGTGGTEVTPV
jgi:hypothetical protein